MHLLSVHRQMPVLMGTHPPTEERIRRLLRIGESRNHAGPQSIDTGAFIPKKKTPPLSIAVNLGFA